MEFLATLFSRLPLSSIRIRILVIALLPALLTEFGLVAYFTTKALASAESALHVRAANAARHLADAATDALQRGDSAQLTALLNIEMANSQLAMARVTDARGQTLASTGNTRKETTHRKGKDSEPRFIDPDTGGHQIGLSNCLPTHPNPGVLKAVENQKA